MVPPKAPQRLRAGTSGALVSPRPRSRRGRAKVDQNNLQMAVEMLPELLFAGIVLIFGGLALAYRRAR